MSVATKIDWAKIFSRVHQRDLPQLNKLKGQTDATAMMVSSLPEKLPNIDWNYYKKFASDSKIVAEIEKAYSSLKIEPPKAPSSALEELNALQKRQEETFSRFQQFARSYVSSIDEVKPKFEKMIPVKDMSLDEWFGTFPDWSWTPENPSIPGHYGRTPGLTREEARAFEQPDPKPFATETAWKDWEKRKHLFE